MIFFNMMEEFKFCIFKCIMNHEFRKTKVLFLAVTSSSTSDSISKSRRLRNAFQQIISIRVLRIKKGPVGSFLARWGQLESLRTSLNLSGLASKNHQLGWGKGGYKKIL